MFEAFESGTNVFVSIEEGADSATVDAAYF